MNKHQWIWFTFGVQTVAPSSIIAWLKSPGLLGSTIWSAKFHMCSAVDWISYKGKYIKNKYPTLTLCITRWATGLLGCCIQASKRGIFFGSWWSKYFDPFSNLRFLKSSHFVRKDNLQSHKVLQISVTTERQHGHRTYWGGDVTANTSKSGQDSVYIAIHHSHSLPQSNGGNGTPWVATNTRQLPYQTIPVIRKLSFELLHHLAIDNFRKN